MAEARWPDEDLVVAAQGGDVGSISALVSSSHPHAQEAVIILYRKIGTLRASGALASWMFRIVRNECIRRSRLMLRRHEPIAEPATRSAEEDVLHRLEVERVAEAIAALPADQRRVLVLRDVQGYSGRMVADALGLSTAAMKSRLHRARTAVHSLLEESHG